MYRIFATIVALGMGFYAMATILDPQSPAGPSDTESDTAEGHNGAHPRASWSRASWSSPSADALVALADEL